MKKKLTALLCFFSMLIFSVMITVALKVVEEPASVRAESSAAPAIRGPVQVVRFTLYDIGIYPQEARAKQGMVTIAIEDLSGDSSGLIIERVDTPSRVPAGRVNKESNSLRSRSELFLPEGRYEVADANRPDDRALLIVER